MSAVCGLHLHVPVSVCYSVDSGCGRVWEASGARSETLAMKNGGELTKLEDPEQIVSAL